MPNVVEQLRQIEGFDQLPPERQEVLIVDALRQESQAPSDTSATQAGLNPAYNQPMQVSPTTFHEGGTIERAVPRTFGETARSVMAGNLSPMEAVKVGGLREMGATFGSEGQQSQVDSMRGGPTMAGSLIGTVLGAPGGPVTMAAGDILGTATGYGIERLIGSEKPGILNALMALGPTVALNASPLLRKGAGAIARASGPGKQALENVRGLNADKLAGTVAQLETGQVATDAAERQAITQTNDLIKSFNTKAATDHAEQVTARAFETTKQKIAFDSDTAAYQAVLDAQSENTQRLTNLRQRFNTAVADLRAKDLQAQLIQQTKNIELAALQVGSLPNTPTAEQVKKTYATLQTISDRSGISTVLPELSNARKSIERMATALQKEPGSQALGNDLMRLAKGKAQPVSLIDTKEIMDALRRRASKLRDSTAADASTDLHTTNTILKAYEDGVDALAARNADAKEFVATLKLGRAQSLRQQTVEELDSFLNHDMVAYVPGGPPRLDATKALNALESKGNETMRRFMERTVYTQDDDPEWAGRNLYDITREHLTQMSKLGLTQKQVAALTSVETGVPQGRTLAPLPPVQRPPRPDAPAPFTPPPGVGPAPTPTPLRALPEPRSPYPAVPGYAPGDTKPGPGMLLMNAATRLGGPAAAFGLQQMGLLGGTSPQFALGAGFAATATIPNVFAKIMSTPWGQRQLLKLMETQGTELTPPFIGFVTAATRGSLAQQEGQYNNATP
mgnify:CR=1 FL=1